jgi:hypothetical protein
MNNSTKNNGNLLGGVLNFNQFVNEGKKDQIDNIIDGLKKGGSSKEVAKGKPAKKKSKKKEKFPDMSGDGKVTKKDILMAKGVIKK